MPVFPEILILAVMTAGLVLYVLLGGADFGGGMWDLLAFGPRGRAQREAIASAIGPVWEANHVWLILVIVLLFTAFPPAFGLIMTALHVPLTLVLVGVVLRGTTFVFRKYDAQDDAVHRRWSTIFGVSSFLTPLLLGVSLGGLASGDIRAENGVLTTGFFAGWTTFFALVCGLFAQGLFAFIAAVYLTIDTRYDPVLQDDFRLRALLSGLSLGPVALLLFWLARTEAPLLYSGLTQWWAPLLLGITSVCAVWALVALYRRRYRQARGAAVAQVSLVILGWAFAQYPYLIPGTLSYLESAAPGNVLWVQFWCLIAGLPVLVPSLVFLFRTFKSAKGEVFLDH